MITTFISSSAPEDLTIKDLISMNPNLDTDVHFSVLYHTKRLVYDRLSYIGYNIPVYSKFNKRLKMDNSIGKSWANHLRNNNIDPEKISTKMTIYPRKLFAGQKVAVYNMEYEQMLIDYIETIWLPVKAKGYFQRTLGQDAVDALNKVLSKLNQ